MLEILLSEVTETLPVQAIDLENQINHYWVQLGSSVFQPGLIIDLLSDMTKNPVCLSVTGALLVVFGFKIFSQMIFAHLERR